MPNKTKISVSLEDELVKYIDSHFKIPGTNWSRSDFIENCIRDRLKTIIKPEDHLKNEIKFHEEKRKFHANILAELYEKEKRMKGQLKLIPTKTLKELKKNSDRLTSYEAEKEQDIKDIMEHAPLHQEKTRNGAIVGQNISKEEMREKALKIIEIKQ